MFQALRERMEGYDRVSSNARLRQLLAVQGGIDSRSNFIANRLAELRGQQPVEEDRRWVTSQNSSHLNTFHRE